MTYHEGSTGPATIARFVVRTRVAALRCRDETRISREGGEDLGHRVLWRSSHAREAPPGYAQVPAHRSAHGSRWARGGPGRRSSYPRCRVLGPGSVAPGSLAPIYSVVRSSPVVIACARRRGVRRPRYAPRGSALSTMSRTFAASNFTFLLATLLLRRRSSPSGSEICVGQLSPTPQLTVRCAEIPCVGSDRITMIPSRSIDKRGSQAARSCLVGDLDVCELQRGARVKITLRDHEERCAKVQWIHTIAAAPRLHKVGDPCIAIPCIAVGV